MATLSKKYEAIVIGTSAGGLYALLQIFGSFDGSFSLPIIVVQHRSKDHRDLLEEVLQDKSLLKIKQADEKEKITRGFIYIAPPDYHLLVEENKTFSLSADVLIRYSRPSIDVLFETAADAYGDKLIGIVLTGANNDGSAGIKAIKKKGGFTIAQDPAEAMFPFMPQAAIENGAENSWKLQQIRDFLLSISK